jgi:SAM-dependent methyltransferase
MPRGRYNSKSQWAQVSLDHLAQWSEWPSRIVGCSQWQGQSRSVEDTDREYDIDKYGRCRSYCASREYAVSPDEVKDFELGSPTDSLTCVSMGEKLFAAPMKEAIAYHQDSVVRSIVNLVGPCSSIVELGCGYGYNLWRLRKRVGRDRVLAGGDRSQVAIELGKRLFQQYPILLAEFDFLHVETYKLLERVPAQAAVVTCFSLHYIADDQTKEVINNLRYYKQAVQSVVFFEPFYELANRRSVLGLMRRRYIDLNGYNRNALGLLQGQADVEILSVQENVFGLNPLLSGSIVHWRFRS